MRIISHIVVATALCVTSAFAQSPVAKFPGSIQIGGSGSTGDVSAMSSTATGSTTSRTLAARSAEQRTVRDWGAACDGTTDDSTNLAAAATALRGTGASIYIPPNCRIKMGGASQVWLKGVKIVADGVREFGSAGPSLYGQQGGTILITTTGSSPFVVSEDWGFDGVIFNWPNQTEAAAVANSGNPVVYPALISSHGTDTAQNWSFTNNQVENAYDVIDLTGATSGVGHFHYEGNMAFALRYHFRLKKVGGESFVTNNQWTPQAMFYGILGTGTTYLRNYAAANSTILRIEGDGTTSAGSSTSVDAMKLTNNIAFLLGYGLHVVGGTYNIATWTGNDFDQVPHVIAVDSGGLIASMNVNGGYWLCQYNLAATPASTCLSVNGGAPGSSLVMTGVDIPVVVGAGIVFHDTGTAPTLTITGGRLLNVGNISSGNPYHGIDFNAANGVLNVSGLTLTTTAAANSASAQGIVVGAAKASTITGTTLGGWNIPLVYNAVAGTHIAAGNTSYGTTSAAGTAIPQGAGAPLVAQSGNRWDTGAQYSKLYAPSGQTSGMNCGGADANVGCLVQTKGIGGVTVNSGIGTLFTLAPGNSSTQIAFPAITSAASGQTVTYSASSGDVTMAPGSGGKIVFLGTNFPQCSTAPSGTICLNGAGASSALIMK